MSSLTQYLDLYRQHSHLLAEGSCEVLNAPRQAAAQWLSTQQLPTKRVERYKYTNADAAFSPDFGLNFKRLPFVTDPYRQFPCSVSGMGATTLFVLGDVVMPLYDTTQLPEGLSFMSMMEAAEKQPELLKAYYNQAAAQEPPNGHKHEQRTERDVITQLNTLLVQDGIFIHLKKGVKLESALQIVFISVGKADIMSNRRVLVIAEEDSHLDLLVCEHAEGNHRYLTTQVTEIFAADRAEVNMFTLEETSKTNTRFCNVYVEQQADSRVNLNGIALITGLSRTMTNARLLGEGADCQNTGAVIADGHQHVDNTLLVDHVAESCTSDMLYKYVIDGQAEAIWAGKVLVRPGAQHTLSHQSSANITLSPNARVHSLPMLEIYADDVRCNHGSTVGKLDETALLYCRQRGIPEAEARLLLQHAFINDVLQRIPIEALRERLSYLVDKRFRGELQHCKGCHLQ